MKRIIDCETHGKAFDAYLCIHLAGTMKASGFNEADPDPGQGPVAWCNFCEYLRTDIEQSEWDAAIIDLLCLVCQSCYNYAKANRRTRR